MVAKAEVVSDVVFPDVSDEKKAIPPTMESMVVPVAGTIIAFNEQSAEEISRVILSRTAPGELHNFAAKLQMDVQKLRATSVDAIKVRSTPDILPTGLSENQGRNGKSIYNARSFGHPHIIYSISVALVEMLRDFIKSIPIEDKSRTVESFAYSLDENLEFMEDFANGRFKKRNRFVNSSSEYRGSDEYERRVD